MDSERDFSVIRRGPACFSIMPFAVGFEDIDRIVSEAARECGLE